MSAIEVSYSRNVPSDSSASITKRSSEPVALEAPSCAITPPLTKVGSASSALQRRDDHARRGGLAVRPCHRDEPAAADQPVQRLRAVDDRHPALLRRDELGVLRPDRAGVDDRVGIAEVRGVVPDVARVAPRSASSRSAWLSARSEPDTRMPRSRNMRASPDMPEPPMPMKCAASMCSGMGRLRSGLIMTRQS